MEEFDIDVTHLLAAIIDDFGGELSLSPKALSKAYGGKAIEIKYVPERDVFVLLLDDKESLENEDV